MAVKSLQGNSEVDVPFSGRLRGKRAIGEMWDEKGRSHAKNERRLPGPRVGVEGGSKSKVARMTMEAAVIPSLLQLHSAGRSSSNGDGSAVACGGDGGQLPLPKG